MWLNLIWWKLKGLLEALDPGVQSDHSMPSNEALDGLPTPSTRPFSTTLSILRLSLTLNNWQSIQVKSFTIIQVIAKNLVNKALKYSTN